MRGAVRLVAVGLALISGQPGSAMDATVPQRLEQPIPLDRPDQTLFNEAVLIFSNEVRRENGLRAIACRRGAFAGGGRPRPQHGTA